MFQKMMAQMGGVLGGGEGEVIGMDMMGFMMDIPLLSLLHFQESALPEPADDLVDTLLGQVYGTTEE